MTRIRTTCTKEIELPVSKKSNSPPCARYGLTDFRQKGSDLIASVCSTGEPVAFSTSTVPQIRMRSAALNKDEAADIPDEARFTFVEAKAHFSQIRAAIMLGEPFLVTSKKNRVILDRHPECPHQISDGVRERWQSQTRAKAHAITRKHAKVASQTSLRIEEMLESFLDQQEALAGEIVKGLTKIGSASPGLSPDEREKLAAIARKVEVLWFRAGARKDDDNRRPPDERDLDRY
jgi:hypothetical protein